MKVEEAVTIPTREAWICTDCDLIVSTAGWCPACCNTQLLNLAKILHPEAVQEALRADLSDVAHFGPIDKVKAALDAARRVED